MSPKTIPLQCPVCVNNVTKTQTKVGCGICGFYYHPTCAGISAKMFEVLNKTHATFICKSCSNPVPSSNTDVDIIQRMEEIKNSIESKLDKNKSDIEERMNSGFLNLEAKVDRLIGNFRNEVSEELSKIKSDVSHCYSVVKEVDRATNSKMEALMAKNNVLERRINRSDILINGLPNKMDKIHDHVIRIAQLVGVHITVSDINHCCFIKNRKCILVKFNSVYIRDNIMRKYYKSHPILLKNVVDAVLAESVVGGDVAGEVEKDMAEDGVGGNSGKSEARVYLRDNLSPASLKLQYICRKLLLQKKIQKFHLKNMDIPKAKIIKPDGSVVYLNIQQCVDLLDGGIGDKDACGDKNT